MEPKMGSDSGKASKGIGFVGALGLLFIAFKLLGIIDWPWVWVLAPLWGYVLFIVLMIIVYVLLSRL